RRFIAMHTGRNDQGFLVRVSPVSRWRQPQNPVGLAGNLGAIGQDSFGFGQISGSVGEGMAKPVRMEIKKTIRSVHRYPAKGSGSAGGNVFRECRRPRMAFEKRTWMCS